MRIKCHTQTFEEINWTYVTGKTEFYLSTVFLENNNNQEIPHPCVFPEKANHKEQSCSHLFGDDTSPSFLLTITYLCMTPLFTCLYKTPDISFSLRCSSSFSLPIAIDWIKLSP